MKCPKCLNKIENDVDICPICGAHIRNKGQTALKIAVATVSWVIVLAILGLGIYVGKRPSAEKGALYLRSHDDAGVQV